MKERLITKYEVMPAFLQACPSFEEKWREHLEWWKQEEAGLYNDFAEFARHLVELFKQARTEEFPGVFSFLERLVINGDHYVQEAAIIGLIEDLRYEGLEVHMLPESRKWYDEVVAFWQAERRFVGEGIPDEDKTYLR